MPRGIPISDETRTAVIRLLRMGWTCRLIGSELQLSEKTVWKIGADAGVHSQYQRGGPPRDPDRHRLNQEKRDNYIQHRSLGPGSEYGVYEETDIDGGHVFDSPFGEQGFDS